MIVRLHHRIGGNGPRVLLLHAVGMDLTFLDPVAAALAQDFTVLRVIASCPSAQTRDSSKIVLSRATEARRDGIASILDSVMERWFNDASSKPAATLRFGLACCRTM
jgi:hypothetical protein